MKSQIADNAAELSVSTDGLAAKLREYAHATERSSANPDGTCNRLSHLQAKARTLREAADRLEELARLVRGAQG